MLKKRNKLILKLLVLSICSSLLSTTVAFAKESIKVGVATNKIVSSTIDNESNFKFDSSTGTITKYTGQKEYTGYNAELHIPNTIKGIPVKSIGEAAFEDCKALRTIVIPNSVKSIGKSAFAYCENLSHIALSENVTSIGDLAFFNCYNLSDITIPDSLVNIGQMAFQNCNYAYYYVKSEKAMNLLVSGYGIKKSRIVLNGQQQN
jgi:hypothetical protein